MYYRSLPLKQKMVPQCILTPIKRMFEELQNAKPNLEQITASYRPHMCKWYGHGRRIQPPANV